MKRRAVSLLCQKLSAANDDEKVMAMDKKEILLLDMVGAAAALRGKDMTAVELTETYLEEIQNRNDSLNAYITVTADRAIADAEQADKDFKNNNAKELSGIPLAIKDLFCTKGIYTTAASKILADFVPPYESTVTQKLWDAGGVCLGKTNMDEFAMGSMTNTGYHREKKKIVPTINPWSKESWKNNFQQPDGSLSGAAVTAGGSSGGSAAAVAGLLALGATGSDTGGSIRQPCAFTALVGVKPTYGRCSRYGMVAFASSLDQAGVMTRSVRDAALMLGVIAGHDEKDSTSANVPVPKEDWIAAAKRGKEEEGLKGLRVALPKTLEENESGEDEDFNNAYLASWKKLGCEPKLCDIPISRDYITAYYIIAPAEAASNLARYDGVRYGLRSDGKNLNELYENTRHDGFGEEVKRRILIGNYVLSAGHYDDYFKKAQQVRRLVTEKFLKIFEDNDVLIMPAVISYAFLLNTKFEDPTEIYKQDLYTIPVSLAGLPVGVVRMVNGDSFQVICKHYDETTMFRVMAALEKTFKLDINKQLLAINGHG